MKIFQTAALLAEALLEPDQFVETYGLAVAGDGGAARYYIIAPATPVTGDVTLANGNIAQLIFNIKNYSPIAASETEAGVIELATQAEVNAGVDNVRAITPATLKATLPLSAAATEIARGVVELATQVEVDTGTDSTRVVTPATLKNMVKLKNWVSIETLVAPPNSETIVIGGNATSSLAAISEDTFAHLSSGPNLSENCRLSKYRYNENDNSTTLLGQSPVFTGATYAGVTALTLDRVVIVAEGLGIQTYDWTGSAYAAVGSPLAIAGMYNPDVVALNSTDIAIWHTATSNTHLKTYRFNGSTWSQVGNTFSLGSNVVYTTITAFNSTTVVVNSGGTTGELLRAMSWDGTNWTVKGSASPDPYGGWSGAECDICAINTTDILHVDRHSDKIAILRFLNDSWTLLSLYKSRTLNNSSFPAICALKEDLVILDDNYTSGMDIYRLRAADNNSPYRPF